MQIVKELPKRMLLAKHIKLMSKQNKSKNIKINIYFFRIATTMHFLLMVHNNIFVPKCRAPQLCHWAKK